MFPLCRAEKSDDTSHDKLRVGKRNFGRLIGLVRKM
jgi:hypothetical protein